MMGSGPQEVPKMIEPLVQIEISGAKQNETRLE